MPSPEELALLAAEPLPYFADPDPAVRRLAVSIAAADIEREGLIVELGRLLRGDESARVRAEAAEVLSTAGSRVLSPLLAATADPDPVVLEAVATGLGEIADAAAVPWLLDTARDHADRLVREAAVAALGAIGDDGAIPLLLDLVKTGPPQVRRRAVVALTVFDGDDVRRAIEGALADRNPMVREAAEMVVGRPIPPAPDT